MFDELKSKTKPELREIAKGLGLSPGPNLSEEKLIDMIERAVAPKPEDDVPPVAVVEPAPVEAAPVAVAPPVVSGPVQELRKSIEEYQRRGLQVVSIDNDVWHFRVGKREDSGTMHQPLKLILRAASLLLQQTSGPTVKGRNDR